MSGNVTQEKVDQLLTELAGTFRRRALTSADGWQQVPLLCVVANGRSGWNGAISEATRGRYPLSLAGGAGIRIRCTDEMPMSSGEGGEPADDEYLLSAAADLGYALKEWDGNRVAERLVQRAQGRFASMYDPVEQHRTWKEWIAEDRIGFRAGWEGTPGAVHEASEVLVKLAGKWEGSLGGLVEASIRLAGVEKHPEVKELVIHRARLEYEW